MEWLGQHPHAVQTDPSPKHFLIHIGGEVIVLVWVSKLETHEVIIIIIIIIISINII